MMRSLFDKAYHYWKTNLRLITYTALTLVFMEWLFIITKPSFLSATSVTEKFVVLFMSSILVIGGLILLSLPILVYCSIFPNNVRINAYLISIIPAIVQALFALLLVDNFTYTLFRFGVLSTSGFTRAMYLTLWCLLLLALFLKFKRNVGHMIQKSTFEGIQTLLLPILMIAFSTTIILLFLRFPKTPGVRSTSNTLVDSYPNIVLFTADGVNAENISLYGYERETTPFLDSQKSNLMISQNNFTNSGNTAGSIVSMMTGKYPTTTRVLYPPDVLRGEDNIEHLPGFLKNLGYYTAQFAVKYYVDSSTQNLKDSFDESNGIQDEAIFTNTFISNRFPEYSRLFLNEIEVSFTNRLRHMFFIEDVENPFLQVSLSQNRFQDTEKVIRALKVINQKSEPAFIHIHWMGTHGDKFFPDTVKYSIGIDRDNQPLWDMNLYDDAIIDLDAGLRFLFDGLSGIGELENTMIILSSDHGQQWSVNERLPLIIYAPFIEAQSLPTGNTQNIDIAPTVLDLLNVDQPDWMSGGRSILTYDQSENVIISARTSRIEAGWKLDQNYLAPPYYQFDFLTAIDCDRYYDLDLEELSWSNGVVSSYFGTCTEQDYASKTEIRELLLNRLIQDGFEFDQRTIPEIP